MHTSNVEKKDLMSIHSVCFVGFPYKVKDLKHALIHLDNWKQISIGMIDFKPVFHFTQAKLVLNKWELFKKEIRIQDLNMCKIGRSFDKPFVLLFKTIYSKKKNTFLYVKRR